MTWSRAWFTLVAVIGAAGIGAAVLLPFLVQNEIERQANQRLMAAATGADAAMQLHARRWIDAATHAALDEQLAEALDHASTGSANVELLHVTARERLRSFASDWKVWQVIAVDVHGRVLARAGAADERWRDDLSPAQVVVEALKGFRLDDTWLEDGRLLKVAAAPVIARERYAGALVVAIDLASDLAQPLADQMGVPVAFVAGGKQVGASAGVPPLDGALDDIRHAAGARQPESVRHAWHDVDYLAVARAIAGSAMPPAHIVVVAELPRIHSLSALRARLAGALGQLPWLQLLPIGIGLVAALLLGWFLMSREHSVRLDRLLRSLQSVSRGDSQRVEDHGLGRLVGAVARAANAAIDRGRSSPRASAAIDIGGSRAAAAASSVPEIPLEPLPPATGPIGGAALPPLAFTSPPPAPPSAHEAARAPAVPPAHEPLRPAVTTAPTDFTSTSVFARARSTYPAGSPAAAFAPSSPADSFHDASMPGLSGMPSMPSGGLASLDEPSGPHPTASPLDDSVTLPRAPAPALAPAEGLEAEFNAVFQDFIDTRQRCGESIEGITFDRFASKLRGNRDQLMARFGCKGVKFQVYVKDGKAALKATPTT